MELLNHHRPEDERKRKIADKLTKWEDGDQPEVYLFRFEDIMRQACIPQQEWPQRLRHLLTGSALTAYSREVPEDAKESYPEFKEALLNALGLSVHLGVDLGITKYLIELHERQEEEKMYDRQTISAITRELDRRKKEEEEQDLKLCRQDQACPVSAEQC